METTLQINGGTEIPLKSLEIETEGEHYGDAFGIKKKILKVEI